MSDALKRLKRNFFTKTLFCQFLDDGLFQCGNSLSGSGGGAEKVFNSERKEFRVREGVARVGFVEEEEDGLLRAEGGFGDLLVFMVGVFSGVDDEEDKVGGVDGIGDLVLDVFLKVVGGILQTGGVDQEELIIDLGEHIVARSPLFAGDNGDIFVRKTIKQAGFAGVGLAN